MRQNVRRSICPRFDHKHPLKSHSITAGKGQGIDRDWGNTGIGWICRNMWRHLTAWLCNTSVRLYLLFTAQGPGQLSRYSNSLRAGRSRNGISVGGEIFRTVQTGRGAHPASCIMGTGFFPGVKRPGRDVDNPPHLAPRLKKEYSSTTSTTPSGLRGLLQGEI